jgi:hypothetical protein
MDLASLAGLEGDGDKGLRDLEEGACLARFDDQARMKRSAMIYSSRERVETFSNFKRSVSCIRVHAPTSARSLKER